MNIYFVQGSVLNYGELDHPFDCQDLLTNGRVYI